MRNLLVAVGLWWAGSCYAATVLIVGDSISAAYGIDKEQGWVALFEAEYAAKCDGLKVSNASVSGETTAGGAARLPAILRDVEPDIVVIELGGNDGLRGLSPQAMEGNLRTMVRLSRQAGAQPLLFGMYLPPNYGEAYRQMFDQAFTRVAKSESVALLPFFLDGVGAVDGLMLEDGIHPNAKGQPILLNNARPLLEAALEKHCQ
ncbi:arylesterase [Alcanivorax sp. 1008]|uniref:arylesterase n=1 Tax=Alcanivorax sp. 1008 TaxID=2816853 RepID=UPI001D791D63|nr:arylesterase [Alcanivorax sp. 1008]MCC1497686.1 arylesterase [Alcanivorax sp. 1008]